MSGKQEDIGCGAAVRFPDFAGFIYLENRRVDPVLSRTRFPDITGSKGIGVARAATQPGRLNVRGEFIFCLQYTVASFGRNVLYGRKKQQDMSCRVIGPGTGAERMSCPTGLIPVTDEKATSRSPEPRVRLGVTGNRAILQNMRIDPEIAASKRGFPLPKRSCCL